MSALEEELQFSDVLELTSLVPFPPIVASLKLDQNGVFMAGFPQFKKSQKIKDFALIQKQCFAEVLWTMRKYIVDRNNLRG